MQASSRGESTTMSKILALLCSVVAAGYFMAASSYADEAKKADEKAPAVAADKVEKPEKAEAAVEKSEKGEAPAKEQPEFLKFDKTGKMAPVKFPHKLHSDKLGGCKDCHEGEKPLFNQKRSEEGFKMKDIYAGAACGKCHDGKNKVFAAKTGCMKCHKK